MAGRRISRILVNPRHDDETADASATEDDGLEVSA
jgi:hypothetical protein